MGTLKQSAMFISGETLVIVVPHLTSPSGPMLLTLRGQKSKAHKFVNSHDNRENRSLYEIYVCSDKVLLNSFQLERCESPLCNFQKITIIIITATRGE